MATPVLQALEVGDSTASTETIIKIVGNKNNGDGSKAFADLWMSNEANSGGGVKLQASQHTDNFGARLDFFLGKPSGDGGASGNLTNTMTILGSGQVGIGTTSPGSTLDVKGELRLSGSTSGFVGFTPAAAAGSTTYTLPSADGSTGYVLTTNGSGVLSWAAGGGGATSVGGDLSGTVSNAQIAANAVGTTEIANSSVSYAKTNFADGDIPAAKVNGLTTGLAGKEASITAGTSAQYFRGDKTMQTLDTGVVPENGNLYFLDSRVRTALMSGYAMGSALPIAATDTLLEALAKLEGSIAAVQASGQWTAGSGNVYRTSGNVGIGTATPSGTFEVAGGTAAAATDGLSITLTAQSAGAGNEDGGNIVLMPGTKTGTGTPGAVGIGMVPPAWTGQGGLAVADGIITGQRISAGSYLQFNNAGGPLSGISWVDGLTQITKDSAGSILTFTTNNLERMRVDVSGNVGIGVTAPTAKVHIAAGSTTANTAPLKFIAGPVMTTPEDGAMEYNGTNLSFTIGATRYTVPLTSSSGVFTSTSSVSNSSGNIELAPNLLSGSVNVTAGTSSVNSTSGALVVTGGVGIGGSLNAAGSISATSDIVGYSNVQTRNGSSFILYNPTNDAYASIRNSAVTGEANLQFLTASTARMTIDNSGRVGIGMTPTTQALEVAGNISGTFPWGDNYLTLAGTNSTTGTAGVQLSAGNGASERIGRVKTFLTEMQLGTSSTNGSIPLHLVTNDQKRLSIDVAGNVGIGVLAPAAKLDISGTSGFTLKITDGNQGAGKVLTSDADGVASWTAPASGSAWAIKTSAYTAAVGDRLMVDTSGGAVTVTLPASASLGDTIAIIDVAGAFATNALTVARNGLKIMGLTEDMTVSSQNISFELVYSNATYGWRIK